MSLSYLNDKIKKLSFELNKIIEFQNSIQIDEEPSEIIKKKTILNNHLNELIDNSNKLNKELIKISSSIVERNNSHNYILDDVIRMFKLQENK